jgi:hypothetical protein
MFNSNQLTRKEFLKLLSLGVMAASTGLADDASQARSARILKATLGERVPLRSSNGDVWTSTWADDDNLYAASDDSKGFNNACNNNLVVSRISGSSPPDLTGNSVNCMAAFGKGAELRKEDGASWKASGLICIDGVLYLAVSRHFYADKRGRNFWIQETWDASIIKSTDHGKSWSAAPGLDHAMFPGRLFSNPFFVQYGKNGQGVRHGADEYVYAISNDGTWNNGNFMTFGRVRRDRIGRLVGADWEFIHGYDDHDAPVWRPRHDNAQYVFRNPGRTSMTGVHYIAPLDLYIMPQWYYTHPEDPGRRWKATRFEFYQAPAPWGPWTLFHSQDFEPQSYYNPCIPAKFISSDGRHFWIFTAGDFTGNGEYYRLNMIPVTLALA